MSATRLAGAEPHNLSQSPDTQTEVPFPAPLDLFGAGFITILMVPYQRAEIEVTQIMRLCSCEPRCLHSNLVDSVILPFRSLRFLMTLHLVILVT